MLVLHDDAQREYAYGPAEGLPGTKVGAFTQAAKKDGWFVISMKIEPKRTLQITVWRSKPEGQSRGLSNDLQTSARKVSRSPCGGKAGTGIAA